ncbi:MAG: hypothetical protein ACYTE8_10330 [Planctomycetota bacterium]
MKRNEMELRDLIGTPANRGVQVSFAVAHVFNNHKLLVESDHCGMYNE